MAQRFGAVLKFKAGVERSEAIEALRKLKHLLDVPETVHDYKRNSDGSLRPVERPFTGKDLVQDYDDSYGGPVWYIP